MIKLRIKSLTCKRHSRSKNPVSTNHGSSAILSATLLTEQQVIPSDSCDVNMEEKQMLTGIILNRLLLPHSPQKEAWSKADKLLYNHLWQLREVRQLYSYPSHCRAQTSSPVNASPWEGAICRDVSPPCPLPTSRFQEKDNLISTGGTWAFLPRGETSLTLSVMPMKQTS